MTDKPKPGIWGAVERSTEEEHKAFMKTLNDLFFTREEFLTHGSGIVMIKGRQVLDELKKQNDR